MSQVIIAALVGLLVVNAAVAKGRFRENLLIIKTYRLRHFLSNLVVITIMIGVATLLMSLPFMDKNPILWAFSEAFGWGNGDGGDNLILSGIQWKWYAAIFLPVLMLAIPHLAKGEEKRFREGTRNWAHGVVRSVHFGLVHIVMTIPLGAALALSLGGMWFTHQYFKGGTERSTTYHAVYNSMIVGALFVLILFA